jgi:hypothetical protein
MLDVLVHNGMKSRVPEPVTLVAGGAALAVEAEVDVAGALFTAEEGGAASTKAEAGSPPQDFRIPSLQCVRHAEQ